MCDSNEEYLKAVKEVASERGESISYVEYEEVRTAEMPGIFELVYEFGSWERAKEEAGLGYPRSNAYTESECLQAVEAVAQEIGGPPTINQYESERSDAMPSAKTVENTVGSWNTAIQKSQEFVVQPGVVTRNDCSKAIQQVVTSLKKVPTKAEYSEFRSLVNDRLPSVATIEDTFASDWGTILEEKGFEPPKEYTYTSTPHSGTSGMGYGENWETQRMKAQERDEDECQVCELGNEEHKEMYGNGLEVHHIIPFDEFESYEEANKLGNLVTVCCRCHGILGRLGASKQRDLID